MKNVFELHRKKIAAQNAKMPKAMFDVMNPQLERQAKMLHDYVKANPLPKSSSPKYVGWCFAKNGDVKKVFAPVTEKAA